MSTHAEPASQEQLIAFMEKLADFHESLSPTEQEIMDQLTASGLGSDEVQGYAVGSPLPTLQNLYKSPQLLPTVRPYYREVSTLLRER